MGGALIQILLVEDSATDALLLADELEDSSFGPFFIRRAASLEEALGQLRARRFDVVLLDLGLPDSQGLETLGKMQEENHDKIPIMVLTGLHDQLLGIMALQKGAEDYLVKNGSRDTMRSVRFAIEGKRASEAFLASEQQLAAAVEAAELGLFDWNLQTGNITWSFHYARLLGLAIGVFQGTFEAFKRSVHPEDLSGMSAAIERSATAHQEYRHEYRVVWPDSTHHWIEGRGKVFDDDHGKPLRLMGTVMDVSQRKAVEKADKDRQTQLTRLDRAKLTPRELTLLKLVVTGLSNKHIAIKLKISVQTVAKHRAHLMAKTEAINAADLARMSTLAGIALE